MTAPGEKQIVEPKRMASLEVIFSPAEIAALCRRDLSQTTCVVFDILRATSTIVTALAHGARAVIPVEEIADALRLRKERSDILLAGERDGMRIEARLTGSIPFDLGNSPREFTREAVGGKTIAITTTNGSRALRACAHAGMVLISSFLNLNATKEYIGRAKPLHLLLVCSGTLDQTAYEDVLAAGALCDLVWPLYATGQIADSAEIARSLFRLEREDLRGALERSRNGQRLLRHVELREDLRFCAQRDLFTLVPRLTRDGTVTV